MTTIWHNITFTKRCKAHVLLRLMGDFVCSNGCRDCSDHLSVSGSVSTIEPLARKNSLLVSRIMPQSMINQATTHLPRPWRELVLYCAEDATLSRRNAAAHGVLLCGCPNFGLP